MGTCDELSLDVLVNALMGYSRDLAGLRRVVVGGQNSDWPLPDGHDDDEAEPQVGWPHAARGHCCCPNWPRAVLPVCLCQLPVPPCARKMQCPGMQEPPIALVAATKPRAPRSEKMPLHLPCAQFDIDPMQLPEGMDEEMELLDDMEAAGILKPRSRGGAGGSGPGGEGQQSGVRQGGRGLTQASRAARGMRSVGDEGVGVEEEEEEPMTVDDLWAVDMEEGQQAGAPDGNNKKAWGTGLMSKYSPDQFKRAFPNRGS